MADLPPSWRADPAGPSLAREAGASARGRRYDPAVGLRERSRP